MSRFTFALETALKYRRSIEDREEELLARAIQKVQAEEKAFHQLEMEKRANLQSYNSLKVDLTTMRQQETYMFSLDIRIEKQMEKVEKARKISKMQHAKVIKAASDRKILERLKEKHLEEYQVVLSQAEQKTLDEVGITAFCRQADGK